MPRGRPQNKVQNMAPEIRPSFGLKTGPTFHSICGWVVVLCLGLSVHGCVQGKFVYDSPVSFNNKFRQTLDENGVPTLKNIFDGAFDKTDRMDVDVPSQDFVPQVHGTGKRWLIPRERNR